MRISLTISILFFFFCARSQEYTAEKIGEVKEKVEFSIQRNDPYSAIDLLREVYNNPDGSFAKKEFKYEIGFLLAENLRKWRFYQEAADVYREIYENLPGAYPQSQFYHGLMLKKLGDCENAGLIFIDVKKNYRGTERREIKERANIELKGCRNSFGIVNEKISVSPGGQLINTPYTEFGAAFYDDSTLLFSSRMVDSMPEIKRGAGKRSIPAVRIFKINLREKGPSGREELSGLTSQSKDHGNPFFVPELGILLYTECKPVEGEMICRIMISSGSGNKFKKGTPLNEKINVEGVSSTHPTMAKIPDGDWYLFYSTSDPRGRSGKEIFYSVYDPATGVFDSPSKLGDEVNTDYDEITPFYHSGENALYFSSTGLPGRGGFDVFRISGTPENFRGRAVNLGAPVNSSADDMGYTLNSSGNKGALITNRPLDGGFPSCCDDIWLLDLKIPGNPVIRGQVFSFNKKDSSSVPVEDVILQLYLADENGEPDSLVARDTTGEGGQYSFSLRDGKNYLIMAGKENYFNKQTKVFTAEGNNPDLKNDIILTSITREPLIIKNIYYQFDKSELTEESKTIIDTTIFEILENNPDLVVEIGSHTDSRGTEDYNRELSAARAKSVVDYLVAKGINKDRLKSKGYGELAPIAPNTLPSGKDNPEGRAKNRRTEFRVVGRLNNADGVIYRE